jgi:hypothetical protein
MVGGALWLQAQLDAASTATPEVSQGGTSPSAEAAPVSEVWAGMQAALEPTATHAATLASQFVPDRPTLARWRTRAQLAAIEASEPAMPEADAGLPAFTEPGAVEPIGPKTAKDPEADETPTNGSGGSGLDPILSFGEGADARPIDLASPYGGRMDTTIAGGATNGGDSGYFPTMTNQPAGPSQTVGGTGSIAAGGASATVDRGAPTLLPPGSDERVSFPESGDRADAATLDQLLSLSSSQSGTNQPPAIPTPQRQPEVVSSGPGPDSIAGPARSAPSPTAIGGGLVLLAGLGAWGYRRHRQRVQSHE